MCDLRIRTPVAVACAANATTYPLGATAETGRPMFLGKVTITFHESLASDKGMVLDLSYYDTQGTSGSDVDPAYDDPSITATPPDGQYNMTGTTTAIPNTNKVLLALLHLHPSEKVFELDLGGIYVPAGKTWAWAVINPSGNSAPNCTIEQKLRLQKVPAIAA